MQGADNVTPPSSSAAVTKQLPRGTKPTKFIVIKSGTGGAGSNPQNHRSPVVTKVIRAPGPTSSDDQFYKSILIRFSWTGSASKYINIRYKSVTGNKIVVLAFCGPYSPSNIRHPIFLLTTSANGTNVGRKSRV